MSSSYSTRKRLEKQNPGENSNTWGANLNTNTIDIVDECFGIVSVNCGSTTGDMTLSTANGATDEGRRSNIVILGTPASAVSLFVPAVQSFYVVRGKHTTQSVNVKAQGGTVGVKFDAGESGIVMCNGTQVREIFRTPSVGTYSGVPSKAIFAYQGSVGGLPLGYFVCDGANGTPNLSERFILGTVSDGGSGRTGGSITPTVVSANVSLNQTTGSTVLTSAMIPGHTHYILGDFAADLNTFPAHNNANGILSYSGTRSVGADEKYIMAAITTTAEPTLGHASWAFTSSPSGHTHTVAFETGHKHTITDGRPPYYSLLYIMKS